MPYSIDLTHYEKVAVLEEEPWPPNFTYAMNDHSEDTDPMLNESDTTSEDTHGFAWVRSPWLFLLDMILVMLAVIFYTREPALASLELLGDIKGLVPRFSQQIVVFEAHPQFVSNHTSLESLNEARKHWINLLPPGQGFVKVDEQTIDRYDLPKPVEYNGQKSVGTSMMHSLHCLYEIMAEYDMLAMGLKKAPVETWHMDHCIDYVRQMLLCGGDMALAGEDLPNGSSQLEVPHVCKSFDQMYSWLDDHKDNNGYQFGTSEMHYVPP